MTTSALRTWLAAHDCETGSRGQAVKKLRLGEFDPAGKYGYAEVISELRQGLRYWIDADRDPDAFKHATVLFRRSDRRKRQAIDAARLLELRGG
ncbi:hypothetical protein [Halobaculum rarum]|uniref:hypothetical protein n=1 Tax=Halobaculum rarum TaxID=3075122 RepID=UPI0032AF3E28